MTQRQLVVIAGPETGRTFPVDDGQTLTLGRGQASDTQINDPHMSRVHCRVRVDGGRLLLSDAGSSSGTLVDGAPIIDRELQPGDVFQIGDTRIRYQLGEPQEEATLQGDLMSGRPKPSPDIKPLQGPGRPIARALSARSDPGRRRLGHGLQGAGYGAQPPGGSQSPAARSDTQRGAEGTVRTGDEDDAAGEAPAHHPALQCRQDRTVLLGGHGVCRR